MTGDTVTDALGAVVQGLGLDSYRWHIFLCADQTKPVCCDKGEGLIAWDYLKRRLKELGLDRGEAAILRTKANCLRVCQDGPILLVYPGGYWYRHANPEVIERIVQEHLLGGIPVREYLLATNDP